MDHLGERSGLQGAPGGQEGHGGTNSIQANSRVRGMDHIRQSVGEPEADSSGTPGPGRMGSRGPGDTNNFFPVTCHIPLLMVSFVEEKCLILMY